MSRSTNKYQELISWFVFHFPAHEYKWNEHTDDDIDKILTLLNIKLNSRNNCMY